MRKARQRFGWARCLRGIDAVAESVGDLYRTHRPYAKQMSKLDRRNHSATENAYDCVGSAVQCDGFANFGYVLRKCLPVRGKPECSLSGHSVSQSSVCKRGVRFQSVKGPIS